MYVIERKSVNKLFPLAERGKWAPDKTIASYQVLVSKHLNISLT